MKIYTIIVAIALGACAGSGRNDAAADSTAQHSQKGQGEVTLRGSEDFTIKSVQRERTVLVGRHMEVEYAALYQDDNVLKAVLPDIMNRIALMKKTIKGPMQLVYEEVPGAKRKVMVFLGIPVDNAEGLKESEVVILKKGPYIKAETMTAPGEGAARHKKILAALAAQNVRTGVPIIEIYNETRNEAEVVKLNKATFLYPKL